MGGRHNGPAMTVGGGGGITYADRGATAAPGDDGVERRGNCPSVRTGENFNPNFVMAGLVPATQERGIHHYRHELFGRVYIRRLV